MANDIQFWKPHLNRAHHGAWERLKKNFSGLGDVPGVEWSNRLTSTAGLAFVEKGFIRLSSKLFWRYPEGFILEIIPHELAHIAAWRRFEDSGHGKGWKDCMIALGIEPHRLWEPERMAVHKRNFWMDK